MEDINDIIYNITDNDDNSFSYEADGVTTLIQKNQVSTVEPSNGKTIIITMENKEKFYIWNWKNEQSQGATSAQDLASKINEVVNNTSGGGGDFTCDDVGNCLGNAPDGAPGGSSYFPFYDSGLKKISFTNFFNGFVAALNSIFVPQNTTAYVKTADEKSGNIDPEFNGIKMSFMIIHNLGSVPSFIDYKIQDETVANIGSRKITNITSTSFDIEFTVAPASSTNKIYWLVKL